VAVIAASTLPAPVIARASAADAPGTAAGAVLETVRPDRHRDARVERTRVDAHEVEAAERKSVLARETNAVVLRILGGKL
jgi:hypothetical protein